MEIHVGLPYVVAYLDRLIGEEVRAEQGRQKAGLDAYTRQQAEAEQAAS